jgi:hypothetical protein
MIGRLKTRGDGFAQAIGEAIGQAFGLTFGGLAQRWQGHLPALLRPVPLSLRETGWGYVVRSSHPDGRLPPRLLTGVRAGFAVAGLLALLLPAGMIWRLLLVALLAAGYAAGVRALRRARGCELQVDTRRRELRCGRVTVAGETWITGCVGFAEVTGTTITRSGRAHVLWLQLRGGAEPVPAGMGPRAPLLRINERLSRDFRPVAAEVSSYKLASGERAAAARRRFPPLVPPEFA